MKVLDLIKSYVPRHFRLGLSVGPVSFDNNQDVIESIPIVDDRGSVISSQNSFKSVPSSEVMKQYRYDDFALSALIKHGVSLKVVNVNCSTRASIEQLHNLCLSVDNAEKYVQRVEEENKSRESWFSEIDK